MHMIDDDTKHGQDSEFSKLSDSEIEERRNKHKSGADIDFSSNVDLEQLKREQQKNKRERAYNGLSFFERVTKKTTELFSGGPKSEYKRMISKAERLYTIADEKNSFIEQEIQKSEGKLSDLESRLEDTRSFAQLSSEQYDRITHKREVLEHELDDLESRNQYSATAREKREQVRIVRKEQRKLYRETSQGMKMLHRFGKQQNALNKHYDQLNSRLSKYQTQQDSLGLLLEEWKVKRTLEFPDDGQSIHELYQDIGILAQKMQNFTEEKIPKSDDLVHKSEYDISLDNGTVDQIIVDWNKKPTP